MPPNNSQRRFYVLGWAVVSAAVIVSGFEYYFRIEDSVLRSYVQQVEGQRTQTEIAVAALLNNLESATIATMRHTEELAQDRNDALLSREQYYNSAITRMLPNLRTIVTIGADGVIRSDTRPGRPAIGINVADREYFTVHQHQSEPSLYVSKPVVSRVDRALTWVLSAASLDLTGQIESVTAASVDRRYFAEVMKSADRIDGAQFLLIHDNGVILETSSPASDDVAATLAEAQDAKKMSPMAQQPRLAFYRAEDRGEGSRSNPLANWPVEVVPLITDGYAAKVLAQPRGIAFLVTIGMLISVTVFALLAYRAARYQTAARIEAERATHVKSQFLATMSHEFRTPLNAIMGFAEIMNLETFGPVGHPKYKDCTNSIKQSSDRLVSLVNDLLDLSKIESGEYTLNEEDLDVRRELSEAIQRIENGVGMNSPSPFQLSIAPGAPNLIADRRSFSQIIDNLTANAWKFAGDSGPICVAWSVDKTGAGELLVTDHGPGIPKETLSTLFQPFVQGHDLGGNDPYVARRSSGVGLGLSIVKRLAEFHQATIQINSDPCQGTRVSIRFPKTRLVTHVVEEKA